MQILIIIAMRKKNLSNFTFKRKVKKEKSKMFWSNKSKNVFRKRKKKIKINIKFNKLYLYYFILIFLVSGLLFLTLWKTFKVQNIEIIRSDEISNLNIAYNTLESIRNKSIFFVKEKEIVEKLKKYQKNLNKVEVNKDLPNTIKIKIWSTNPLFNTIIDNKKYIITSNWTLVNSEHSENLINLQIKWKTKSNNSYIIPDYKTIISQNNVKKIANIYKEIKENLLWVKINFLSYYPIEREIHFSINEGTLLIFDLTKDEKKQIKNLIVFNSENSQKIKESLIYIDLRIDKKIFYCEKENEYKCKSNLEYLYKKD